LGGGSRAGGAFWGGGGGGGGGTAELDAHAAETFTAHQIPLQIDNKIATHAALTTTAHDIPNQIDAKIATHAALPNAHHAQSHALASTSALGADHPVSGLTSGQVIKATGATTAVFVQLQHSEIGGVGPNDHHNRQHSLTSSSDHTIIGSDGDLIGNVSGVPGIISPTADGNAAVEKPLKTNSSGFVKVRSFETATNALIGQDLTVERDAWVDRDLAVGGDLDVVDDAAVGGDLDVTGNTTTATLNTTGNADLYGSTLRVRNTRFGVNREPDTQFDGDVLGAFRAGYLVGPHALQIPDATMILNLDRALTGHRGQTPYSTSGAVLYQRGKYNEGLAAYPATTNLIINPSLETDATGYATDAVATVARSSDWSYRGEWSIKYSDYVSGFADILFLGSSASFVSSIRSYISFAVMTTPNV